MRCSRLVRWIQPFMALAAMPVAGFSQVAPTGWTVYPTPEEGSASLYCANWSRTTWRVSMSEAGALHIGSESAPVLYWDYQLPHGVRRQKGMIGRQSRLKIPSGWLLGFDGGEFGGGLWFADSSGRTQNLSGQNVRGFVTTPQGVLVFVGMTFDSGRVLIVHDAGGSVVKAENLVQLDGAPEAITPFSENSALVVTTHGITQVSSGGTTNRLLERSLGLPYPSSIVVTKDGAIYVGMRMFVVRLLPQSGLYTEQWLVRQGCNRFKPTQFDCVCKK